MLKYISAGVVFMALAAGQCTREEIQEVAFLACTASSILYAGFSESATDQEIAALNSLCPIAQSREAQISSLTFGDPKAEACFLTREVDGSFTLNEAQQSARQKAGCDA